MFRYTYTLVLVLALLNMAVTDDIVELTCTIPDAYTWPNTDTTQGGKHPDVINPLNPTPQPIDCYDILKMGQETSGRYDIYPFQTGAENLPVRVWCDMDTQGGGWTVFQRREDGSVNFDREWAAYKKGFGFAGGEHWLGLENVHIISNQRGYQLRIEAEEYDGTNHVNLFEHFRLTDEATKYKLLLGTYTGTEDTCDSPLGMADGTIKDNQITTSSQNNGATYRAINARLNLVTGSWLSGANNAAQWIQVKFLHPMLVTGVITQGRYNAGHWVKKIKVKYGETVQTLQYVKDRNQEKVFTANIDQKSPVKNVFPDAVKGMYIRLYPFEYHGSVGMRFELLGCEGNFFGFQINRQFCTSDADNDVVVGNCATIHGPWWYGTCDDISDLNGPYEVGTGKTGIIWDNFKGEEFALQRTEMKMRPVDPELSTEG